MSEEIKSAFEAAADHFGANSLSFWDYIGRRTIDLAQLSRGGNVLDVGCGSGASALPAAEIVGPSGHVVAIDFSTGLISLGQEKAIARGLRNIDFLCQDMTALDYPENSFDAVVSALSIFFVDDMEMQIRKFWSVLKPEGVLAVTCWGPDVLEPAMSAWSEIVRDVRPDLLSEPSPGDRISNRDELAALFRDGGAGDPVVVEEPGFHDIAHPADWWEIVMGTGLRGVMEELSEDEINDVKSRTLAWATHSKLSKVELNVLYGRSKKSLER
ncbi:methyltransferase family protein [Aliiruegeria haliotis]|uniref:Methyltransferase family protein n=1 Tax=Aliiruegeria haliotis TaxID=1280846 RepID=A0A2T0RJ74_9RHOB|nr:methyltransferase domain-containing protein [Aliiruegeria haliotis]PRY21244.1 methyltransferase family protein [Aliiruegeria haliotis]